MRIQCEYCGQYIDDSLETCPHCGAENNAVARQGSGIPKTVEELGQFAAAHNLPLEKMHVYIGQDYRGPRAYGIYRDGDGNFIVYKNKSDGSRAVRYRGRDEAYAVNELYQKMRSEVAEHKARSGAKNAPKRSSAFTEEERRRDLERRYREQHGSPPPRSGHRAPVTTRVHSGGKKRRRSWSLTRVIVVILVIMIVLGAIASALQSERSERTRGPATGYYDYDDTHYYRWHDNWYYWDDDGDDWYETDAPYELEDDPDSYYSANSYDDGWDYDSFTDSSVYDSDYDDDYDDDYGWFDYDDDDWDSGWDDDDWDYDYDSGWDDYDSGWDDWDSDW